jgi:hypothetical protein
VLAVQHGQPSPIDGDGPKPLSTEPVGRRVAVFGVEGAALDLTIAVEGAVDVLEAHPRRIDAFRAPVELLSASAGALRTRRHLVPALGVDAVGSTLETDLDRTVLTA